MSAKDLICKHGSNTTVVCSKGCKDEVLKTVTMKQSSHVLVDGALSSEGGSSEGQGIKLLYTNQPDGKDRKVHKTRDPHAIAS